MSNTSLLSIIIPVYNVEAYLRRCLDSVCSQSYCNLEIICVDDGSTDGSLAILREYEAKDTRVHVISKSNGGVSSARNAGLNAATGEWVTFVDPDDYMLPGAYQALIAWAEKGVDMVRYGMLVISEAAGLDDDNAGLQRFFDIRPKGIRTLDCKSMLDTNWAVVTTLFRRSVIEAHNIRFQEGMIMAEDQCFYFAYCAHVGRVAYCRKRFYVYARRAGSCMTSTHSAQARLESMEQVLKHVLPPWQNSGRLKAFASLWTMQCSTMNHFILLWSLYLGQPLEWRARLLAQMRQYRLYELPEVAPFMDDMQQQWSSASWALSVLNEAAKSAVSTVEQSPGVLHAAIPVDEAHAGQAFLLALGLRATADEGREVCVHFVAHGLCCHTRERLLKLNEEAISVQIHELHSEQLCALPAVDANFSSAPYLEMVIPTLLPHVERVLVLTPGMLLGGSVPPLESLNMDGMIIATVQEGRGAWACAPEHAFVMNLNLAREWNSGETWLSACLFRQECSPTAAADAFKQAFQNRMAILPAEWSAVLRPASAEELMLASNKNGHLLDGLHVSPMRMQAWTETHGSMESAIFTKLAPQYSLLRRRYYYCKLMFGLTWGRRKRRYREKCRIYREALCEIRRFFKESRRTHKL